MEKFRAILDKLFWIFAITGTIAFVIILMGGAIPVNVNPNEQKVKFDLAHIGWTPIDPKNGKLEIDKQEKNVGWGSMKFTYAVDRGHRPGFRCDNVVMESMSFVSFDMKAEKPTVFAMQIKRKSNGQVLHKAFMVGKKWKNYKITFDEIRHSMRIKDKIPPNDFQKWLTFVDINPRYDKNTVWFDNFTIIRW